jgi:hypothetical protein
VTVIGTLRLQGTMAGMTTRLALAQEVRVPATWRHAVLPITCKTGTCATTERNVQCAVDAEQVTPVLTEARTRVRATARWQ